MKKACASLMEREKGVRVDTTSMGTFQEEGWAIRWFARGIPERKIRQHWRNNGLDELDGAAWWRGLDDVVRRSVVSEVVGAPGRRKNGSLAPLTWSALRSYPS
jgi:hypothetical protein